jgi:hypothetical protein
MNIRQLSIGAGAVAAAGVITFGTALPAMAASGQVYSTGAAARSLFNDQNDAVTACDRSENGKAAVAFIRIKQADGSWLQRGWVVDGNANGENNCVTEIVNVNREGAPLRLFSCESANDVLSNCEYAQLSG